MAVPAATPPPADAAARVRVLSAGQARLVARRDVGAAPAPALSTGGPWEAVAAPARAVTPQVVAAMPPVPDWHGVPSLDEPAFPVAVLVLLGLFVLVTGRGDRRDPKLVRADLDARGREIGFS